MKVRLRPIIKSDGRGGWWLLQGFGHRGPFLSIRVARRLARTKNRVVCPTCHGDGSIEDGTYMVPEVRDA